MPRKRSRRGPKFQQVTEILTFDSGTGTTQTITRANLPSIPSGRAFRVESVRLSGIGGIFHVSPTASLAGDTGTWPTWIQLRIFGPSGANAVATTGPVLMSSTHPTKMILRNPRQQDWVPLEAPGTHKIFAIDHGCVRLAQPTNTHNSGVLHIQIRLSVEEIAEACPTLHIDGGEPSVSFCHISA